MTAHAAEVASLGFGARRLGEPPGRPSLSLLPLWHWTGPSSAMVARDRIAFALAGVR